MFQGTEKLEGTEESEGTDRSEGTEKFDHVAYLRRLAVEHPGAPSVAGLHTLHRAQVERVAYETIGISSGQPIPLEPADSAQRIIAGWGGYCYNLNGAFAMLLAALGYQVRLHVGGVTGRQATEPTGANGNHLALTVHGLPTASGDSGVWFVDVGLGDGLHEPLPLRAGHYQQGPFTFQLVRSEVVADGWCFRHDPAGSFQQMDFGMRPAVPQDFAAMHTFLSSDPESIFVRTATAQRRYRNGVSVLRGCVFTTIDANGKQQREVTRKDSWLELLRREFQLPLTGLGPAEREKLWQRVYSSHRQWCLGAD